MAKGVAAVLALIVACTACSLRPVRRSGDDPQTRTPTPGSSSASTSGSDGSPRASTPATPGTRSSGSPGPAQVSPPPPDSIPMTVTPDRRCAEPGSPMTIEIVAEPEVGLSMVIGYSDSQAHGNYNFGDTDASGRYVWAFIVSPQAPRGKATVAVVGRKYDGSKGGQGIAEFQVGRC